MRSHADFVDAHDLLPFLKLAKPHLDALDVMVEAKNKDQALKQLMKDLVNDKQVQPRSEASFEL